MPEIADAWVSIYPKFANGFASSVVNDTKKAMKTAADESDKSNAFGKAGQDQGKKFGNGFKAAAGTLIAAVSIGAIKNLVTMAVDSYAELQDATSAAAVVFGNSMDKIQAQAKTAATTMGMSKKEVIDAAMTFGTYGKSANLAGDDLANFSTKMVALAGDMASFRGTSTEQAVQAIGAAMRGEMEPIRAYSVMLDDAKLRQRALTMGLIATTKDALTPQQKVLASQAEILAQTTYMTGDYLRTADSAANVNKTMQKSAADLSAELGEKLEPAITAAKKAGIELLTWITDNQAALVPMVATFGTLALAVGGFVGAAKGIEALKSAKATIDGLKVSFDAMSTSAKAASIATGAIGIAAAAASIGYGIWAQATQDAQQQVEDMTEAIKADSGALGENARAYAFNALQKSGVLDTAQKMGIAADVAVDAALGEADAIDKITAARERQMVMLEKIKSDAVAGDPSGMSGEVRDAATVIHDAELAYDSMSGSIVGLKDSTQQALVRQKQFELAVGSTGTTADNTKASVDGMTGATHGANDAANDGKTAFDKYAEAINKTYKATLGLRGDKRALEAAIDDASESVKKNGKTLDTNTEKGRANQEALDGIATAGLSVAQSMKDNQVPAEKIAVQMDKSRESFIKAAKSMGMSSDAAKNLADDIGLVKGKSVTVTASVSMNPKADEIVPKLVGHGGVKFSPRADGGEILPDRLYMVGERGPEFLVPRQAGYVVNQQQAAQAAAGAGARSGRAPIEINIVEHNPVAQPTSTTVNKALQYAAALGVF